MEQTDRELLELAAKAMGMKDTKWTGAHIVYMLDPSKPETTGSIGRGWNPLTDDGDAFRLAVKLCMQVECSKGYQHASVYGHDFTISEQHNGNAPEAATRRAIVRAAAKIAKV
jgi:hypothetical protein